MAIRALKPSLLGHPPMDLKTVLQKLANCPAGLDPRQQPVVVTVGRIAEVTAGFGIRPTLERTLLSHALI